MFQTNEEKLGNVCKLPATYLSLTIQLHPNATYKDLFNYFPSLHTLLFLRFSFQIYDHPAHALDATPLKMLLILSLLLLKLVRFLHTNAGPFLNHGRLAFLPHRQVAAQPNGEVVDDLHNTQNGDAHE